MKEFLKAGLVAATILTATMAQAGGPVLIEEGNNELIEEAPARKLGILPILGLVVLVGLVAGGGGGGSDGAATPDPEPEPPK